MEFEYRSAVAVTPHNSNDQGLDRGCSAIGVGVAGDVKVKMFNGADVIMTLPVGIHSINVKRIYSTSTTATNLTAYWR